MTEFCLLFKALVPQRGEILIGITRLTSDGGRTTAVRR